MPSGGLDAIIFCPTNTVVCVAYVPDAHAIHVEAAPVPYVPTLQLTQPAEVLSAYAVEKLPAPQAAQLANEGAPIAVENVPGGHALPITVSPARMEGKLKKDMGTILT